MTQNLEATVFVFRHRHTGKIKAEYAEEARLVSVDDYEHLATLEPRMWIEYHFDEVSNNDIS